MFTNTSASYYVGKVFLLYGRPSLSDIDLWTMNSSVGVTIYGGQSYDQFGISLAAAGDLNGDGKHACL